MDQDHPPHPDAVAAVLNVWAYTCGGCGEFVARRLGWYTPSEEYGEHLYHAHCAPQQIRWCTPHNGMEHAHPIYWWCRRGRHVVAVQGGGFFREDCDHSALRVDRSRMCAHCAVPFTPARSDARYCSVRCRVAAHRARVS